MIKKVSLLVASVALATSFTAQAYQAGDIIVRGGVIVVNPQETSGSVYVKTNGASIGGGAGLKDDTQLGLNFQYMLLPNLGIELLAATPFEHDVSVSKTALAAANMKKIGTLKHLPPTVSAVFYPLDASSPIQPYAGVGINYTLILDGKVAANAKAVYKDLDADDSVGWAAQLGFDYVLPNNLILNAQVRYIDIKTTAHADTVADKVKVDVAVDPLVYMVGVGYKF